MGGPALGALKAVLVGAAVSLLAISGLRDAGTSRTPGSPTATQVVRDVLDRTEPDARCTRPGAPEAVAARRATALVRRPGGAVVVVPFREAWDVYTHKLPGTFVSLCLGRAQTTS
jgi:hypothetical protein